VLDMKRLRDDPDAARAALRARGDRSDLDRILELDNKRREVLARVEALKAERNAGSKEVARLRKSGADSSEKERDLKRLGEEVARLDRDASEITEERDDLLAHLPNIRHASVPDGKDSADNVEVRSWGEKPSFDFEPKPHWDLGASLGILDMERGAKLSGAHWALFRGAGALLERALIGFMLDLHTREHGYTEIAPPYLVRRECMFGTGQLPKFEEDMYAVKNDDLFLIPTAEVPLTNLHRGEILQGSALPLCYTAYSACFRYEAGAYGRDTRGMQRIHQFDKVELVRLTTRERSYDELELMVSQAEEVLKRLGLHFRTMLLCAGDLGFSAAKCYDIEVWAPGMGRYLEVSSCSNCEDFQARRAQIRYRDPETGGVQYCHTLNGSGVALPRLFIALVETFQEADGSVRVPEALRPYAHELDRITVTV
jgi:seryl-tRNA synthetase